MNLDLNSIEKNNFRRKKTVCEDGYSVSIQASEYHYCEPRINLEKFSDYDSYELGFPSIEDDLINEYAEDPEKLTETVYGHVPKEVVLKLLEKHGGISQERKNK